MEDINKRAHVEGGDKEILYSKAIKAGKRIYYLDVKKNLKDDLFLAITESKKIQPKDGSAISFEKHKIFLYKEDFDKFLDGMHEVIDYIKKRKGEELPKEVMPPVQKEYEEGSAEGSATDELKLDLDF